MRTLITLTLTLVLSSSVFAEDIVSQPAMPLPLVSRMTTIEGKGWSLNGFNSQAFACQHAYFNAFEQLKQGMAVAKSQKFISQSAQVQDWPATIIRNWNQHLGRCTITIRIDIPSTQDRHDHFVGERQRKSQSGSSLRVEEPTYHCCY